VSQFLLLAWIQERLKEGVCQVQVIKSETGMLPLIALRTVIRRSNLDVQTVLPGDVCINIQSMKKEKKFNRLKVVPKSNHGSTGKQQNFIQYQEGSQAT
jgi:hypothetical protein